MGGKRGKGRGRGGAHDNQGDADTPQEVTTAHDNENDDRDVEPVQQQQQPAASNDDGDAAASAGTPPRAASNDRPSESTPAQQQRGPANYGATSDVGVTPTPARQAGGKAPPPTPATAYREQPQTSVMRHSTGAIVGPTGSAANATRVPSPGASGPDYSLRAMVRATFLEKWQLKLLLIAVPVAIFGNGNVSSDILFFASFFGLVPLAGLLGDFTEDLALRSNDVIGALINVTFGNATELIISIMALRAGMMDVIKLSLIGSVLGNMLLVLGTAFLVGGFRFKDMRFNADAVNTYGPLLMLAMLGFMIPSAYWATSPEAHTKAEAAHDKAVVLSVSRQLAFVMAVSYAGYLYFQLVTHKHLFDDSAEGDDGESPSPNREGSKPMFNPLIPQNSFTARRGSYSPQSDDDEDEEEDEEPVFTFMYALVGLAVVSVLISMLSDILVETLTDAADAWHLPKQFIGIILVPIVGNAAEHASAIFMAARNKMDIAVGVALGSSIQIAMFVMPVLVIAGWVFNAPLDMDFHPFLTVTTFVSVLVVQNITSDGKTNWLEGLLLIVSYVMIALMFWNSPIAISN